MIYLLSFLSFFIAQSGFSRTTQCYDRHDTLVLTMHGSEDNTVDSLHVVYKGIDLGHFTKDRLSRNSFDDIELDVSPTINYGDIYLWMMWDKVRWFTWARTDGTASRFRGKVYCHDISEA